MTSESGRIKLIAEDPIIFQDTDPLVKSFFPGGNSERALEIAIECSPVRKDITLSDETGSVIAVEEIRPVTETDESDTKNHRQRIEIQKALYRLLSTYTGKTLPWGILMGVRPSKLVYERIEKGLADHVGYLMDEYLASQQKARLATLVAAKEYRLLDSIDYKHGYSVYIGIPFCPSICNYCSFGSHPLAKYESYVEPYLEALRKEIRAAATMFPNRHLDTVYFGGGTPTTLTPQQLKGLIEYCKECFDFSTVKELTVEAGRPDSITREKLMALKECGVTRISINPQSMVDRTLSTIGRAHTPEDIVEAFRLAREMGFDNINMDIIAGLTGETLEDFEYTLSEIEKLSPESLTIHTLAHKRAALLTTQSDRYAGMEASNVGAMVEKGRLYAKEHGYEPYYMYRQKNMTDNLENVGYAKTGYECLYNVLIMEEKQIILALGAGGSSKLVRECDSRFERVENVKSVVDYVNRIDEMIERKVNYLKEHNIV